jgi:hypothetical protein
MSQATEVVVPAPDSTNLNAETQNVPPAALLPIAVFKVKIGKVVDAACSGELWRGMTYF